MLPALPFASAKTRRAASVTAATLALALALGGLATGCVSRSKYLDALQASADARSATVVSERDLAGVAAARDQQAILIAQLRDELQALRESQQAGSTASRSRVQDLMLQLEASRAATTQAREALAASRRQLGEVDAVVAGRRDRHRQVADRLARALTDVPPGQSTLVRGEGATRLELAPQLLFRAGKRAVTPYGDALLSRVASALGGRSDLAIAVIVTEPTGVDDTGDAAWRRAAERATALASNLVEQHGLLPRLVTASAREREGAFISDSGSGLAPAPSERTPAEPIVIEVRLAEPLAEELARLPGSPR